MTNKGNQSLPEVKKTIYSLIIKRLLDLVLSGLAIIILSPVFLVVAILELIIHGRPIVLHKKGQACTVRYLIYINLDP